MKKIEIVFTTRVGNVELSCESRSEYLVARFWANGDRTFTRNCVVIPALPDNARGRALATAVAKLEGDVKTFLAARYVVESSRYVDAPDQDLANELWWKLRTAARNL